MLKLSVIVLCLHFINVVRADKQEEKAKILKQILYQNDHDLLLKPGSDNATDSPTTVSINFHIISVSQIDDLKMLYTLDLYFRQTWTDKRLRFAQFGSDIEYLVLSDSRLIWTPDIFFPQEYKSYFHDLLEPNTFVKINENGTVFRSVRITLTLRCAMNFGKFPYDKHVCPLTIESYRWRADEVNLQWSQAPITSSNEILSPLFSLDKFTTHAGLIGLETGEYSILSVKFHFSRLIKYYVVHLFIPACLIFNVSCLAAWLNPRLMTARILIGLASLFSLAMLILHFDGETPKVAYPRAIDVFMGMCMTFIFCTLLETIFVHLSEEKPMDNSVEVNEIANKDDVEENDNVRPKRHPIKQMKEWLYDNHQTLNDIDAASRVLFPVCFVIFNVIYSITCAALNEP